MNRNIATMTSEQLRRELLYYRWLLGRTRSKDRIRRAHVAIARRERLLAERPQ
jgi:hypothetical protein